MTAYIGGNKIKDTGEYGVYVGSPNTNCLTYTPKNINLELNNGTLTLKAGSKVYVPNGKNTDGSLKFDEVVIESDLSYNYSEYTYTGFACYDKESHNLVVDLVTTDSTVSSGNYLYYDTANNVLQQIDSTGAVYDKLSFPIGIISMTAGIGVTSIDQIFDWCGYIGSTAFVLPKVKGLIPNGFNADGTYKSIEVEISGVKVASFSSQTGTYGFVIGSNNKMYVGAGWYHDTKNNVIRTADGAESPVLICSLNTQVSSGKITSLTPYTAQPSTTAIPINAIYNGSQLVYQYKQPGEVLFEQSTAGTYTFTAPYNCTVDVILVAGGGGGSDSWGGNRRTGGSGGMVTGSIAITKGTTYTIVVGGGGAYGYGSAVDKAGQGATGGTTSAFGNNAYGGAGGYTHTGWGAVIANNGAGGSYSVVSGFTGSNGVEGSTTNR